MCYFWPSADVKPMSNDLVYVLVCTLYILLEQHVPKNVTNCLNTNIYSHLRHLVVKVLICI